jgi:HAE1 family hydrophobic/amphiphilic exporter-1
MLILAAVRRPVAVLMLFTGLVIIGLKARERLSVDLLPAINYPNLTVITNYSDTPADDLTRLVTRPLEEVVSGLAGVRRVVSKTREGTSTITVQYEWGTDMDFANLHLREAIDRVAFREDFPSEADRPLILRWDPTARPIAILVLGGDDPLAQITEFAREVAKPALEQIDGISQAEVLGGAEREILVRPDFAKLRLYGLTVEDLSRALQIANISFPGGRIRKGPLHLPLRILGEFESLEEIRQTEIPAAASGVTIGDICEVLDTIKEPEGMTLLGDQEVVSLHLYKEVGANTIDATDEVDLILDILLEQYPDFSFDFVYRDAEYVSESFEGLQNSLLLGAALAFLVLFFFLMDWRSPIVVGLAIPVSILTTFALLHFAHVNLNLMSLGGLSLAAGMLVDNSIVVLENINRHLRERSERKSASTTDADIPSVEETCAQGAQEVASPVIAATLTTVAVFFPVIYVPGIAGEFFRDQALTVTFSLLVSILAALILQPMLSARILSTTNRETWPIFRPVEAFFSYLYAVYHRALLWTLDHKMVFLLLLSAVVVTAGALGSRMNRSFLPERSRGDFTVALELPAGTPVEQTYAVTAELASYMSEQPQVATVYTQVGVTEKTLASLKEYSERRTGVHPRHRGRRSTGRAADRHGVVTAAARDRWAGRRGDGPRTR